MNGSLYCNECGRKIEDGKTYQDRYFFNYHCSWNCLVEYMCEFFDVDKEPEITVINGVPYSNDELDENGNPAY